MRKPWLAGAALAAALVLSGCGGDDGGDNSTTPGKPGASTPADGTDKPGEPGGGTSLQGSWIVGSGESGILLSIVEQQVALVGPSTCSGTWQEMGFTSIMLTCVDGNTDRTNGAAKLSGDGKSLEISWDAGIKETYQKVADPKDLPTDFPTSLEDLDLPTDLPTDLLELPEVPELPELP